MALEAPGTNSPAVPAYIFRGHISPIHSLHFFASNAFLASADSDGWLVVWSLASRRAVAVWKAHDGGILGVQSWGNERLITHGRDHKLRVWRLQEGDLAILEQKLPIDGADAKGGAQPWLLHSMDVNALNFCAFATCYCNDAENSGTDNREGDVGVEGPNDREAALGIEIHQPILIAAPNGLDSGGIDFFHLPSEHRVSKLPADRVTKTGMVMALSLFYHSASEQLTAVSGYEDGHTMVHVRQSLSNARGEWTWKKILTSKPHSQPLLSLDMKPSEDFYITSSADAVVAKFTVPPITPVDGGAETKATKIVNTKHAGQQGLRIRSDGKIFATAGWDARIRVYSAKTLKELAVLKWHRDGCYSVAFAEVDPKMEAAGSRSNSTGLAMLQQGGGGKSALDIIKQERSEKAQTTHWLAAGGKDGKVSLWDIY